MIEFKNALDWINRNYPCEISKAGMPLPEIRLALLIADRLMQNPSEKIQTALENRNFGNLAYFDMRYELLREIDNADGVNSDEV